MKNCRITYCTLLLVCSSVFIAEDVVFAQESADSSAGPKDNSTNVLEQDISIPEDVLGYFPAREMPYVDEISSLPKRALPIITYRDSTKSQEFIDLFVWANGTIVWRHNSRDGRGSDEYRLSKIDKERIENINTKIVRKGAKYFSGKDRDRVFLALRSEFYLCRAHIMLPNFFYEGALSHSRLNLYLETKEALKEFSKEERVMFIKKITGYISRPLRDAFHDREGTLLLLCYKNLLIGRSITSFTDIDHDEVLSDDEIDAIAPYLFDDLDFFLFCRDIFLSLIPSDGQGTQVEVKYASHETTTQPTSLISWIRDATSDAAFQARRLQAPATIVTVYRDDGKIRYEYHRGAISEYHARNALLQKRLAEKTR